MAREFSALAWLGTLCHLDLELLCVGEVECRDTKAARSNLLDG